MCWREDVRCKSKHKQLNFESWISLSASGLERKGLISTILRRKATLVIFLKLVLKVSWASKITPKFRTWTEVEIRLLSTEHLKFLHLLTLIGVAINKNLVLEKSWSLERVEEVEVKSGWVLIVSITMIAQAIRQDNLPTRKHIDTKQSRTQHWALRDTLS